MTMVASSAWLGPGRERDQKGETLNWNMIFEDSPELVEDHVDPQQKYNPHWSGTYVSFKRRIW